MKPKNEGAEHAHLVKAMGCWRKKRVFVFLTDALKCEERVKDKHV